MSKFVMVISEMVDYECRTAMLIGDMEIARLMTHAEQMKEAKLKDRVREKMRSRNVDGDFSHEV